jgi:GNAT superfamily N-acetyltransferase
MRDNPEMGATGQPRVQLATPGQLGALSGVLGRAFAADPMMTWPLGDVADPQRSIEACFRLLNAGNIEDGLVFEAAGGAGVAVWVPPDLAGRWAETERLARPAIYALADDGGARYERLWGWVEERMPAEPLWYLDQLGVDPARQAEGLGKALVRFGLARAADAGLPAFLETATERNVLFYQSLGFRVVDVGSVPGGGPRIWFLRHDPEPATSR